MARVTATDHADRTGPSNYFALLTNWFYARADLHVSAFSTLMELELFVAIGDATASHVVGRNLHLDLVAGKNTNAVHAHLSRTVSEDGVTVL